MANKNKKQTPGLYSRLNSVTQLMEERSNRALRRRNFARARKMPGETRNAYKANKPLRNIKASRLYEAKI